MKSRKTTLSPLYHPDDSERLKQLKRWTLLVLCTVAGATTLFFFAYSAAKFPHYSVQALAWLNGSFAIDGSGIDIPPLDMVPKDGHLYWPLNPFPSMVMFPFVMGAHLLFGIVFPQSSIYFLLACSVFFLAFLLAQKRGFARVDSFLLATVFCFGSMAIGVFLNANSWHFGQVVVLAALFGSLLEFLGPRRYWLIGLLVACAAASRLPAGATIIFFILEVLFQDGDVRKKLRDLALLLAPVAGVVILLGLYNYFRFGSVFDNGYMGAMISPNPLESMRDAFGLFDIRYFVQNFFYYFLKLPQLFFIGGTRTLTWPYVAASPWGLSFFIVAPFFVKAFVTRFRERRQWFLFGTSLVALVLALFYFATGYWQYGPRYMLDFFPFIYMLLLMSFKGNTITAGHTVVIAASCVFNVLLLGWTTIVRS